ncbi:MAG: hypothetical protein IT288_13380 [Bdellovibrionales bacterium]|nr:hypothetical protein [Bdellovibrionales bacterium]
MMVCQALKGAGFKAYLAGGCVRDALLGRLSHDFDVATDARPEQIEPLFPKSLPVGKQFGVVILPYQGFQIEVATFRSDGEYRDGRHPTEVQFSNPEQDALRRDFTVNALFYDLDEQRVIDYVDGVSDLQKRILRSVGDPQRRFAEDRLRVLRAIRIAAQLEFDIERSTFQAVGDWGAELAVVSQERITGEIRKMLALPSRVQALHDLQVSGLAQQLLPDLKYFLPNHELSARRTKHLAHLYGKESRPAMLWALLLWQEVESLHQELENAEDWPPLVAGLVELVLRHLKCSNHEIQETTYVLTHYRDLLDLPESDAFKPFPRGQLHNDEVSTLLLLDHPNGVTLLDFAMAVAALEDQGVEQILFLHTEYLSRLDRQTGRLPPSWVNGHDLVEIGFSPGPEMGLILEELYRGQITGDLKDKKEALTKARALRTEWAKNSK